MTNTFAGRHVVIPGAMEVLAAGGIAEVDVGALARMIASSLETSYRGYGEAVLRRADFSRWATRAEVAVVIAQLVSPLNPVMSGALVPGFGRS